MYMIMTLRYNSNLFTIEVYGSWTENCQASETSNLDALFWVKCNQAPLLAVFVSAVTNPLWREYEIIHYSKSEDAN